MDMDKTCGTCGHCRNTHDGPYCFKGAKPRPVSPIREMDCWADPAEVNRPKATKVCAKCGRELPIENFGRHSRTKDGYQPCCKECLSEQNSGKGKRKPFTHNEAPAMPEEVRKIVEEHTAPKPRQEAKTRGRKISHPDIEKDGVRMHWCGNCLQYKPVEEFSKDLSNKSGLATQCKACRVVLEHKRRVKRREEKKAQEEKDTIERVKKILAEKQDAVEEAENDFSPVPEEPAPEKKRGVLIIETPDQAEFRRWAETHIGPKTNLSDISIDDIVKELRSRGVTGQLIINL